MEFAHAPSSYQRDSWTVGLWEGGKIGKLGWSNLLRLLGRDETVFAIVAQLSILRVLSF